MSRIFGKESLGVVSLILGIVLSGINIYLFFNSATKRELENLKASIEQLSLQPSFDVTYYAVGTTNPLGVVVTGNGKMPEVNHPLTESQLLVDKRGKQFFLEDSDGTVPIEVVQKNAPADSPTYDQVECSYYVVNFKYTGAVKLPAVDFEFETLSGGNGLLPTIDVLQFVGSEGGESQVTAGLDRTQTDIEVANVEKDDSFFVPLTMGCAATNTETGLDFNFSFRKIGLPSRIKFHNPISEKDEALEVRKMLNNAIINSAGVLERG